ncbi:MAG TPA: hypothetical protein VG347_03515 [Verrucomicrobiae bacterium]|nr:hypothetical protein [Verrucomicrobiae bacterium]
MKIPVIKTIKKTFAGIAIGAAAMLGFSAAGQTQQFSQPLALTGPATSGVLATTPFMVQLPPISLTIQATNANTVVTNIITQIIAVTNSYTFIYNAATMGTNFTTNFNNGNGFSFPVTNRTYGLAIPQSGGSNNCLIQ